MKKLPAIAAATLAALNLCGQGTVLFSNIGARDHQKVWLDAVGVEAGGTLAPVGATYQMGCFMRPPARKPMIRHSFK